MESDRWEIIDRVTRHIEVDVIFVGLSGVIDRDGDVAAPPDVAVLKDEMGDLSVAVEDEPIDSPDGVLVTADDVAGPPNLDLVIGHVVECRGQVLGPGLIRRAMAIGNGSCGRVEWRSCERIVRPGAHRGRVGGPFVAEGLGSVDFHELGDFE